MRPPLAVVAAAFATIAMMIFVIASTSPPQAREDVWAEGQHVSPLLIGVKPLKIKKITKADRVANHKPKTAGQAKDAKLWWKVEATLSNYKQAYSKMPPSAIKTAFHKAISRAQYECKHYKTHGFYVCKELFCSYQSYCKARGVPIKLTNDPKTKCPEVLKHDDQKMPKGLSKKCSAKSNKAVKGIVTPRDKCVCHSAKSFAYDRCNYLVKHVDVACLERYQRLRGFVTRERATKKAAAEKKRRERHAKKHAEKRSKAAKRHAAHEAAVKRKIKRKQAVRAQRHAMKVEKVHKKHEKQVKVKASLRRAKHEKARKKKRRATRRKEARKESKHKKKAAKRRHARERKKKRRAKNVERKAKKAKKKAAWKATERKAKKEHREEKADDKEVMHKMEQKAARRRKGKRKGKRKRRHKGKRSKGKRLAHSVVAEAAIKERKLKHRLKSSAAAKAAVQAAQERLVKTNLRHMHNKHKGRKRPKTRCQRLAVTKGIAARDCHD